MELSLSRMSVSVPLELDLSGFLMIFKAITFDIVVD